MQEMGRLVLWVGLAIAAAGLVMMFADKIPGIDRLGRLPGDIAIKRENFSFHFPVVTSIIVSIVLTVLLNIFFRR